MLIKGSNMDERGNYLIDPIERLGSGSFGVVEKIKLYNTKMEVPAGTPILLLISQSLPTLA